MSTLNLTPEPERAEIVADDHELLSRAKGGANWFYWIAALSVVNSLIFHFGGNMSFFAGLGVTQLADAMVFQLSPDEGLGILKIIGFAFDLIVAGIFLLCGLWANRLQSWAFLVGMILYLLDGLLLLVIGVYLPGILLPAAFHAFALFMIFRGFSAARQLKA
ncbi:MAG TPA: hypothetical protein VIL74_15040 [Pyrinomonadaceae bacterium]|jgi:hypothetical protein